MAIATSRPTSPESRAKVSTPMHARFADESSNGTDELRRYET